MSLAEFLPDRFSRTAKGLSIAGISALGDRIANPFIIPLGGLGIDGISPRVWIRDGTDVRRMIFLADEGSIITRWAEVVRQTPCGSCVIDVGAGAGAYSLVAASYLSHGQVISIEPDPETYERLGANIRLNLYEQGVKAFQIALGAVKSRAVLYTSGANGPAPRLRNRGYKEKIPVRVYSLDYLVEQGIIPPPFAIKIDVEGAEVGPFGVFAGMSNLLRLNPPRHIFLGTHGPEMTKEFSGTTDELLGNLRGAGYQEKFRYEKTPGIPILHLVHES